MGSCGRCRCDNPASVTEHNKKAQDSRLGLFRSSATGLEHRGGKPTYIIAGDIIKYFSKTLRELVSDSE